MDDCPSELERERFLAGTAAPATAVRVELHRERCPDCRAWFERAQADDELLAPLRELRQKSSAAPNTGAEAIELPDLDRYRIRRILGFGGMGVVYEAEQQSPRRQVALKLVRPGLSSDQLLRRFEFEAEILGRLDHPGIARIYEAGTLGNGVDRRPFFAMELVRGLSLKRFVEELGLEERLELFCKICDAVEHAHQKGVIHRDLKPANILVTEAGEPKILDFGVARATDADLQQVTLHTNVGQLVGTLAYMSPEQLGGDSAALDVRSDVYALGVIYYELLADERPYDVGGKPITECLRIVKEQEPRPLGAISASLRGDLETIGAKALEKQPGRRYGSAAGLAADVRRYLKQEPIAARPASTFYQLVRFSQRHRALVGGALAVVLALALGLIASWILKGQSDSNAAQARRERSNVLRLSAFHELEDLRARADALWPILPEKENELVAWLDDARRFVAGLHPNPAKDDPGHYAQRESIRLRALPLTEEEHETQSDAWAPDTPGRRPYDFEDGQDRWWYAQLDKLILEIESFMDPDTGWIEGISPEFAWGVERRLAWARAIEDRSTTGVEVRGLWSAAIESIAQDPVYAGLELEPLLGLLPLGRDPDSGFWEFAHVQSGELPGRNADGHCVIEIETAIVLVLIPGGTFLMGSQKSDPSGPNYYEGALSSEWPVHQVTLSPFLLSKFEMTQGQWLRLTGGNLARYAPGSNERAGQEVLRHPVESVSWEECWTTLHRFGLELPSEAQWEYAARARTSTPWWTGLDKADLAHGANLADETCRIESGSVSWVYEDWDDGHYRHAPVGTYRANAFGIHDVLGNLWEWCADESDMRPYSPEPALDPCRRADRTHSHVARGASFMDPAAAARSSRRNNGISSGYRGMYMGVRPALSLSKLQRQGESDQ